MPHSESTMSNNTDAAMSHVEQLVHKLQYAAYRWGFEAGKVGQHVDTTIAGNMAIDALRELLAAISAGAQPAAQEPVGVVGTMPGTDGFTMACFKADDVPVGTKLYAAPHPAPQQPADEEAARRYRWLVGSPTPLDTRIAQLRAWADEINGLTIGAPQQPDARDAPYPESHVNKAAKLTLERMGYSYHGGEFWKPPLGAHHSPDARDALVRELVEALRDMEAEKSEYMIRNKLGDPAGEDTNRRARAVLAKAQESTS